MDKSSHTNHGSDKNHQQSSGEMSTHGEIHKRNMAQSSASVSLDSGLTSALSRAPSPFASRREPEPTPEPHQSPQGSQYEPPATPGDPMADPQAPREPYFGGASPHTPPQEHHYEPSMDDMFHHDQNAEMHDGYVGDAHQHHREPVAYPAQYQDGMHDVFDEASEKPNSRRTSFILLSALALVAVIAGGVIYFYKSQTSSDAAPGEVPVIKAEQKPTKITPEKPGGIEIPHQKKLIYDRITGENTESSEQVVSRQEPVTPVAPAQPAGNPFDQQNTSTQPASTPPDAPVTAPQGSEEKAKAVLPPNFSSTPGSSPTPQTQAPVAIAPQANAQVSSTSGDYLIQIASFRTQEEAIRNYENLNRRYSGLLSPYGPLIQKADLGSRGVFYRLRIGPMDSKETAQNLCSNLVAQGQKDCLVRRK